MKRFSKSTPIALRVVLVIATISLLVGFYVAWVGTNDCDLADKVLGLGLPGLLLSLIAAAFHFARSGFSIKSRFGLMILVLLMGFVGLGFVRSHLSKTAVGDCY